MDLHRYLARIGLPHLPSRTANGLAAMQQAHRFAIGFENLDIPLGRGIAIDAESVFDKLVIRGRGGYCFEQNRLFSDALSALGIANRPLLARVRMGVAPDVVTPRTHTCLLVTIDGEAWLADAGFGGSNVPRLLLRSGSEATTADGSGHRLLHIGPPGTLQGEWRLERAGAPGGTDGRANDHGDWQPQYTFDLAEVADEDMEQANHWTSTRPGTRFTTLHVASRPTPDGFASLTDRVLTLHGANGSTTRTIMDAADYARTLREVFEITLSEEEALRLPLFA